MVMEASGGSWGNEVENVWSIAVKAAAQNSGEATSFITTQLCQCFFTEPMQEQF